MRLVVFDERRSDWLGVLWGNLVIGLAAVGERLPRYLAALRLLRGR